MRPSHPTLVAASRAIASHRDAMVARWNEWLGERLTSRSVSRAVVERQLRLIIDVLAAMIGPLRRETKPIWAEVTEHYGRIAAVRGLAAGEVVEEMQYLREVLIRHLAPSIAAMRPRQGMALLLRLNRLVDKGVAMAVVGYTDALVHTLLPGDGPSSNGAPSIDPAELQHELDAITRSLQAITGAASRR
ncbi:MAG TPA: RsbRD N-terminal domain-containing protein [Gemmatimonadales bacterium]